MRLNVIGAAIVAAAGAAVIGGAPATATGSQDPAAAVRQEILAGGRDSGAVATLDGGWNRCPAGYFCIFDGYDGSGRMAYFRTGSPNLGQQGMDKKASSQTNRSRWTFAMYEGCNYTGRVGYHPAGSQYNLSPWGGDNFDSSLRRV
ncbi:peptidase inhibitor family I36 protein [Amycolatopsis rubida]|uniref:Peptidase inhibitor family I36 n=1 Tax=Amycolatopsis rubida TaxID=112413 RepID=A0A1I5E424_9PSEU|nr:peptidase inhibitor family I36 protein [Amycolatopsis rubida]SFO06093.1 Peptidase inhibitor family I36 [Amycolatopsis rubida]